MLFTKHPKKAIFFTAIFFKTLCEEKLCSVAKQLIRAV